MLQQLIDDNMENLINHPWMQLVIVVVKSRHIFASDHVIPLGLALAGVFGSNMLSRRANRLFMQRGFAYAHPQHNPLPLNDNQEFFTHHLLLNADNAMHLLMASAAIPAVMSAVTDIPLAPKGSYRDGGLLDYHLDLPYQPKGLLLYPHFTDRIIPGWFDKSLSWRKAKAQKSGTNLLTTDPMGNAALLKQTVVVQQFVNQIQKTLLQLSASSNGTMTAAQAAALSASITTSTGTIDLTTPALAESAVAGALLKAAEANPSSLPFTGDELRQLATNTAAVAATTIADKVLTFTQAIIAAPNDIFLQPLPANTASPLSVEASFDIVNDTVDIFNIRESESAVGDNAGDYNGGHLLVNYAFHPQWIAEAGYWNRNIEYGQDSNEIDSWLAAVQYTPLLTLKPGDEVAIRLVLWGNQANELRKTSTTIVNSQRLSNLKCQS